MEEDLAKGGRGMEAHWRCFHLDISQILPMCVCATAMTTFLEMAQELICIQYACICLRVYFACVITEGDNRCVWDDMSVIACLADSLGLLQQEHKC